MTPIRSGDTVTIKNEISLEWTGSKKIDVWSDGEMKMGGTTIISSLICSDTDQGFFAS